MDIYLDKRAVRQIRVSADEAIEEGDTDTLREDIMEAFSEEQIEEIERRVDSGDVYDFLSEMLDEWSGDDVDELFELLEAQCADAGLELKFATDDDDDDDDHLDDDEDDDDEPLPAPGGDDEMSPEQDEL